MIGRQQIEATVKHWKCLDQDLILALKFYHNSPTFNAFLNAFLEPHEVECIL